MIQKYTWILCLSTCFWKVVTSMCAPNVTAGLISTMPCPENNDMRTITQNWNILQSSPTSEQSSLLTNGNITSKDFWSPTIRNLTDCLSNSTSSPQSHLFVILVSADFVANYKVQIIAMKLYCRIHGYRLKIIDPLPYFNSQNPDIKQYVNFKFNNIYTTSSRPAIMREIF